MNLQFLRAPEDVDAAAWGKYFAGVRNQVQGSLDDMLGAYRTFRKIRESFGLPVVGSPGEGIPGTSGALTYSLNQQILELASMADVGVKALDDALANKRKIAYDRAAETFQVERLPDDAVRIEERNNRPTLISNSTNQPTPITGTIGLAQIAWVALGIAGVIVTVGALYTVNTAMESATKVVQANTQKTIALKSAELIEKKLVTPAEGIALSKATYEAAADLETARGSAAGKTGLTPDTNKTIRTVAIVGAIGVGLYLISKVIPDRIPRIVPA